MFVKPHSGVNLNCVRLRKKKDFFRIEFYWNESIVVECHKMHVVTMHILRIYTGFVQKKER